MGAATALQPVPAGGMYSTYTATRFIVRALRSEGRLRLAPCRRSCGLVTVDRVCGRA